MFNIIVLENSLIKSLENNEHIFVKNKGCGVGSCEECRMHLEGGYRPPVRLLQGAKEISVS